MFPTAPSERLRLFFPAIGSVDGAARRYPARVKRRNQMVDRFDIAADGINKEFGVLDTFEKEKLEFHKKVYHGFMDIYYREKNKRNGRMNMKVTAAQYAEKFGTTKANAAGFLDELTRCGYATRDTVKTGGRGRPGYIYILNKHGALNLPSEVSVPAVAPVA